MLHRHKKFDVYMQFGGHIELDETPWQSICHEIPEETGFEMGQLKIMQPKDRIKKLSRSILHPMPVCHNTHAVNEEHNHSDVCYVFVAKGAPAGEADEGESSDVKLFTRTELLEYPKDDIFQEVIEISLFIFDVCLPSWEQVSPKDFR